MTQHQKYPRPSVGDVFGSWTVTGALFRVGKLTRLPCRCACGNEATPVFYNLVYGKSVSCGCTAVAARAAKITTHGGSDDPLYWVLSAIRQRCRNPNDAGFKNYGGRGISLCSEWDLSFAAFREWAHANGYKSGLEIDRIDVDGPYAPHNCRWVDVVTQARNKRTSHKIAAFGETKTIAEWADDSRASVRAALIYSRIYRGWTPERAIAHPIYSALP